MPIPFPTTSLSLLFPANSPCTPILPLSCKKTKTSPCWSSPSFLMPALTLLQVSLEAVDSGKSSVSKTNNHPWLSWYGIVGTGESCPIHCQPPNTTLQGTSASLKKPKTFKAAFPAGFLPPRSSSCSLISWTQPRSDTSEILRPREPWLPAPPSPYTTLPAWLLTMLSNPRL